MNIFSGQKEVIAFNINNRQRGRVGTAYVGLPTTEASETTSVQLRAKENYVMIVNRWWLETVWKPWLQSMMTSLWLSCKFWTANAILSFRSWTSRLDNNSAKGFVLVTWVYFWPEGFWPELFSSLAGITRPPFLKTSAHVRYFRTWHSQTLFKNEATVYLVMFNSFENT